MTWETHLSDDLLRCPCCSKVDLGGAYRVLPCRLHRIDGEGMGWNPTGQRVRLTPIDPHSVEHLLSRKRTAAMDANLKVRGLAE